MYQDNMRQGLYDPSLEHDNCGIGAVVNIKGLKSHETVSNALKIVENLEHRAGKDAEGKTGDGVGILVQISHKFFEKTCSTLGFSIGKERDYGIGMFFMPQDELQRNRAKKMFEIIVEKEGLNFLGWREVPVQPGILGKKAADCMPCIMQGFVKRPFDVPRGLDFDRRLYIVRRVFEQSNDSAYVVSLSSRTIVYKGMFLVGQLRLFYNDLQDKDYESAIALVHSRFSTNTVPSWEKAHPYRYIVHNGEINTIRGNADKMLAREENMESDYPKIAESEVKDIQATGEVVLSRVVIPEYVIVHDGAVSDNTAKNYYVLYKDYIKNVASCEIYSTWPKETLRANILAIMSFTLNRVYTEWYRGKGKDFTITSSTAFDQKWINGKNTYDSISNVVDEIFNSYLSRPEVTQPILTQYCDGKRVSCPEFMSQWGSKALGDDGLSAIEILRYYYGDDMYINEAETISGIPASYPGYELTIGASGQKVRQMQEQLNVIAGDYPLIPKIRVDGIYGPATANSVKIFQKIFHLPETGVVDFATWYKISQIYVAVSRIAELK